MRKILFDLTRVQPVGNSKYHGGGVYGKIVFERLAQIAPDRLVAYYNPYLFLYPSISTLIKEREIETVKSTEKEIVEAASERGDIIYSPLMRTEYFSNDDVVKIITIHGIRDIECPADKYQYWYNVHTTLLRKILCAFDRGWLKNHYDTIMRRVNANRKYKRYFNAKNIHWITVSNHSKYLIMSHFPFIKEDLPVMYSTDTVQGIQSHEKIEYGKYYLMVSANRWIKNAIRGIMAFDELFSERPSIEGKVVLTGVDSPLFFKYKIRNIHRFVFEGYVEESRLRALYRNAYLFFYPTLSEGFGYPPLEAMSQGCPVASSYAGAIPEICGDAVLYFNPYSVSEMKARILQMENDGIRTSFKIRGMERQHIIAERQELDLQRICNFILPFTQ